MKIPIPSETDAGLESIRSGHFGHAAYMTVVEFDDDMNIVGVESVKNADHDAVGCGGVIDFVSGIGVDGILTVGMGMPPFTRFTNAGMIAEVALDRYRAGAFSPLSTDALAHGDLEVPY